MMVNTVMILFNHLFCCVVVFLHEIDITFVALTVFYCFMMIVFIYLLYLIFNS